MTRSFCLSDALFNVSLLFQHANAVRQKCLDLLDLIAAGETKQRPPNFEVPERELPCRFNVQAGTWFARDNVFNFILFCRRLGKHSTLPFFLAQDFYVSVSYLRVGLVRQLFLWQTV